eukprot:scaffold215_cov137-Isochrysis_galbana.AAC.2
MAAGHARGLQHCARAVYALRARITRLHPRDEAGPLVSRAGPEPAVHRPTLRPLPACAPLHWSNPRFSAHAAQMHLRRGITACDTRVRALSRARRRRPRRRPRLHRGAAQRADEARRPPVLRGRPHRTRSLLLGAHAGQGMHPVHFTCFSPAPS